MNKRNSLIEYIKIIRKRNKVSSEFAVEQVSSCVYEDLDIFEAIGIIYDLVRNWSEGMDLASRDTQRPTKYLETFELLFEDKRNLSYKEISKEIGGVNVKKFAAKCNIVAIGKALKMMKEYPVCKQILNGYYGWVSML